MPRQELTSEQIAERAELIKRTAYLERGEIPQPRANGTIPDCKHCHKPRPKRYQTYQGLCEDCFADLQIGKGPSEPPRLKTGNAMDRHQK